MDGSPTSSGPLPIPAPTLPVERNTHRRAKSALLGGILLTVLVNLLVPSTASAQDLLLEVAISIVLFGAIYAAADWLTERFWS